MQALYEQIKACLWVKFAFLSLTSQSFSMKNLQGSPATFFPSQWDPSPFTSALLPWTRVSQSAHAHRLSGKSQMLLLYTPCFLWSFPGFCWYRLHFPSNATLQPRLEKPCVFLHKLSFFTSPFSCSQIPDREIPQGINPRLVRWHNRQELVTYTNDLNSTLGTPLREKRENWLLGSCPLTSTCELPHVNHHKHPPTHLLTHTNNKSMVFFKKNCSYILYLGESLSCIIKYTCSSVSMGMSSAEPRADRTNFGVLHTSHTNLPTYFKPSLCYS